MPSNLLMRDGVGAGSGSAGVPSGPRFVAQSGPFGDVDGYPVCGCCGHFHAIFDDGGGGPFSFLNGDDRGATGSNGKVSLSITGAGAQITRTNLSWATGLGQAATIDFSFRSTAPGTMPSDTSGFSRFTDLQISITLMALASWSDVANITFNRVSDADGYSDNATMVFGNYSSGSDGAAAFAYLPNNRAVSSNSGDIWINSSLSYNSTPVPLGYGFQVITHEIGHAIGLSHPAAYNAGPGQSLSYSANAGYYEDTRQYSVMSYFSEANTGGSFGGRFASAPLLDDIAAAQRLYGANMTTRTGDTVYGFNSNAGRSWYEAINPGSALIFSVWDAGGNDTFDFSGYTQNQVIDLRQGAFSNVGGLIGNVSIALGAVIEAAIGGDGSDTIVGNAANNTLRGGAGNDVIDGGLGVDTVVFSGARSAYTVTWNGRVGTVSGPDGTDTITNVEFLQFSDQTIAAAPTGGLIVGGDVTDNVMAGSAFNDQLNGGGGNDTINAGGGDDLLEGGSGNDTLNGQDGNDTLVGGTGNDVLNGGTGIDTADYAGAATGVTVNLAAGTATGGAGSDTLISIEQVRGSVHADVLTGSAGNDRLDGNGGNDVIRAGAGDDVLIAGAGAATGGAPDIIKGSGLANGGFAQAISLDNGFDLLPSAAIGSSSTIPHATVVATGHGGFEYYAFTVTAGSSITLDIDGASFDSTVRLYGPNQASLAFNDDANPDGGNDTDSQLTFTATQTGVYYVAVGRWQSGTGADVVSIAPPAGGTYTLHVSVANHAVVPLTVLGSSLFGEAGNDTLLGGVAADYLDGGAGSDFIDGGAGIDTLALAGSADRYFFEQTQTGWRIYDGLIDVDTVLNVEQVQFGSGPVMSIAAAAASGFDAFNYMAGYSDLRAAFANSPGDAYKHYLYAGRSEGRSASPFDAISYVATNSDLILAYRFDLRGAAQHYVQFGASEGRAVQGFDALTYAASNYDLAFAFGANAAAAATHYIQAGFAEGRSTSGFNSLLYIASNVDLAIAFGANAAAGLNHYLAHGVREGRGTAGFNALQYVASHVDLALAFGADAAAGLNHYLVHGVREGRTTSGFDALQYLASHVDLARGFGANGAAGLDHYLNFGAREGRAVSLFDARLYSATHDDLARAFGQDTAAARAHYLNHGAREGRSAQGFDAVAYLLSNPDLAGLTVSSALDHWLGFGADEGRIGDRAFGREQSEHTLPVGTTTSDIGSAGDRDWFTFTGQQGVGYSLNLALGALSSGTVSVFDGVGRLVSTAVTGFNGQAVLNITPSASGVFYVVVEGVGGATGSYGVSFSANQASASTSEKVLTADPLVLPSEAASSVIIGQPDPAGPAVGEAISEETWALAALIKDEFVLDAHHLDALLQSTSIQYAEASIDAPWSLATLKPGHFPGFEWQGMLFIDPMADPDQPVPTDWFLPV
jgi:Ca2+-binding RTX toxin-like protein